MSVEKQIEEEFLSIPLRPRTMFFYSARTAILESVKQESRLFYGTVLDVGCGFMPYKKIIEANPKVEKYVGMDLEKPTYYNQIEPDLKWNGRDIPLEDESMDCVMATEFLEHYAEPENALNEIRRVLKPGGRLFATVPFIWNLHEVPYDEYRYTPYSIERHFRNAGFGEIKIKALGGWNLSFAQMIGLWVTFSKMSRFTRAVAKKLLFPFYVWLVKTDRKPSGFDGWDNSMFTGLSITARK
ncbi:MAG TPA: class I SAM-dependent methyltransferase [Pyrinomonadaceae bacterium]|nr:class I SAM-dependent methyltransferase [Pyrinomonadaceae bacterium]